MVSITKYEEFLKVHGFLLTATGVPESLYPLLFQKLSTETFDAGDYFGVEYDGRQRKLVYTSDDDMVKNSNVFLVDHAWTFRLSDAVDHLEKVPGLTERMASLMCVDTDPDDENEESPANDNDSKMGAEEILESEICRAKEASNDGVKWLELEDVDIDDVGLSALDLPTRCPVM